MQPIRVQMLTMSKAPKEIVKLCKDDFAGNLPVINRFLLEIEVYLDQLRIQKLSREIRITLNELPRCKQQGILSGKFLARYILEASFEVFASLINLKKDLKS